MNTKTKIALSAMALGGALAMGVMIGEATADQPHMANALSNLQSAKAELVAATADKGGHRGKAIRDTDAAIAETQAGIAWAATHH